VKEITAEPPATTLDTIGLYCARAVFVAVIVGLVEGVVVSRLAEVSVSGIGIATAGLWVPAAFLFLFPAALLKRVQSKQAVALILGVGLAAGLLIARALHFPLAAEAGGALLLAYLASQIELDPMFRKPIAITGIVLAVILQMYAAHWVDAHRAFASLLVDHTAVPRFMLRAVLRRFV
jgi:hypothetical protein